MSHNRNAKVTQTELTLREYAMSFPQATEDFPWGHRAIKVNKKAFVFMGTDEDGRFGISVKLPVTGGVALTLPFCRPTGYGLGKSGWVDAGFPAGTQSGDVPVGLLKQFIEESYRAVAPKTLVKLLAGGAAAGAGSKPVSGKSGAAKSSAKKSAATKRGAKKSGAKKSRVK